MFFVLSSVSRSFMKFFAVFALCILLSVASRVAFAAEVVVSPSTGTYTKGQSFTTTIQVNPQGKTVNAVEAKLTFDNTKFAVVSVSKTGSVFSLWTTEPTFSNTAGTIDFGGGSPTPFSARSNLVSVTFRTLAEGSGTVGVSTASVLAADGLGTNVYTGAVKGTFTISAATTPTPTPPPEEEEVTPTPPPEEEEDGNAAITFGDPPRAPEAGSTTFLDPDTW
jgi:Cohesin domain